MLIKLSVDKVNIGFSKYYIGKKLYWSILIMYYVVFIVML